MHDEDSLLNYLAAGGKLDAPENVTARYRGELMRLMAVFVDSELAGAAGFADSINAAPGLKEKQAATRIVLEKLAHAGQVLQLMEPFGAQPALYVSQHAWNARLGRNADLGSRRIDGDMRLNVFHYPLHGWLDAVVMNFLMGRATVVQLDELTRCSYQPLAAVMSAILPVEEKHAELGRRGLEGSLTYGYDLLAAQAAVAYWYPRVAATFGRAGSDRFAVYQKYGLREHDNQVLLDRWQSDMAVSLQALGLQVPA